jgi:hypothetical protein
MPARGAATGSPTGSSVDNAYVAVHSRLGWKRTPWRRSWPSFASIVVSAGRVALRFAYGARLAGWSGRGEAVLLDVHARLGSQRHVRRLAAAPE